MATITLKSTRVYEKGLTTKYWRDIECQPQTVELKSWGANNPLFILEGVVIRSHDPREVGIKMECYIQTYRFWLEKEDYQIN